VVNPSVFWPGGDPMCYGIGVTLTRQIPLEEMTIIPSPSALVLPVVSLGWSLSEVETLSLCGRTTAWLNGVLYPGAKLLVLSADAETPAMAARLLSRGRFWRKFHHGFRTSRGNPRTPHSRYRQRLAIYRSRRS
jgi:precorrin-6B methylase 1